MSRLTYISGTTATLCAGGPAILGSILITTTDPPPPGAATIEFFNVASAAGAASATPVFTMTLTSQVTTFSHTFDGAVFPQGLVVQSSVALNIVVETL